jgi:GlpG protein
VVYALFGYVWMKAKFQPTSGFHLDKQTVLWMVGWFVLCLTGALGNIGNVAHGVGFAVGAIWGFTSAKLAGRRPGPVWMS